MNQKDAITDVPGIEVGHAQDDEALTGCTVVLCRAGATAGVDVRGGAPGTRETDLLSPINLVEKVHAVMLAGGSAFGLDAASGVMRYLEENKIGFDVGIARVPIVPAAILFDLGVGRADVRPDAEMGYKACLNATKNDVAQGNVGAGTGACVGNLLGVQQAMKSGVGSASMSLESGIIVGALVAVNPLGDVVDPINGKIIAGLRLENGSFADTQEIMKKGIGRSGFENNTVIGVVAVNALLTKADATKVAQMAHDGLARVIRPAHTMWDGDTIFALGTGEKKMDISTIGACAAEVFSQAILRAVKAARSAGGLPGLAG